MQVKVGCCGFPVGHSKYYRAFSVVELQSTFYQLPEEETAIRWRKEAPAKFEFTVKAWQAITHPISSPTWRKGEAPPSILYKGCGLLRPTRQNYDAWDKTLDLCHILGAKVCVIQTPPQFRCSSRNVRNMERFFAEIERDDMILAWEPRDNWARRTGVIKQLCKKLGLIHVVDLLREEPAYTSNVAYFRMHGLGEKQLNYSYHYTQKDLSELSRRVASLSSQGVELAYVMFNNISMLHDARLFAMKKDRLSE